MPQAAGVTEIYIFAFKLALKALDRGQGYMRRSPLFQRRLVSFDAQRTAASLALALEQSGSPSTHLLSGYT